VGCGFRFELVGSCQIKNREWESGVRSRGVIGLATEYSADVLVGRPVPKSWAERPIAHRRNRETMSPSAIPIGNRDRIAAGEEEVLRITSHLALDPTAGDARLGLSREHDCGKGRANND
jgi:hypothetical protein